MELQEQLLQSALDMAARGLRVFPLVPGTKIPAVKDWPNVAFTDPERIRKVWALKPYNIGVAMGGGMLGLDVDMKNGKDGMASLRELGVELNGFVVRTPTGGKHGYYLGPDVSNSAGRLGHGLDVRSGGGFLVGPGSRTEDGDYILERAEGFSAVPAAIVQRFLAPAERARAATVDADEPGTDTRAIEYLANAESAVEGAGGDHTTYTVAARLKDFGVSEETAYQLLLEHWNERCEPPWAPEDLRTKVANAYEYGTSPLGIAHPSVDFANVKPTPPSTETPKPSSWFRHGDARGVVDWLYYQTLPKVGVGVLLAPTGSGKTFLAIELARSLATGKPFFKEEPDETGGTLFVFAGTEGSGLALRLDALQENQRLPISATVCGNLSDKDALTNLLADLQAEAAYIKETFGVPVRLVVLETMAASGLLQDENDNSEASQAMSNLAQISRAMNALVLTSHHPSKDGKGSRGASAIPSSADYVIEIGRDGRSSIREVELVKARDAEVRRLGTFSLVPVNLGEDARGRDIQSMSVSMGDAIITKAMRAAPHADKLIQALEWALNEAGDTLVDGRRAAEFSLVKEAFKDLKGGSQDRSNVHKVFVAALDYCEGLGKVEVVAEGGEKFLILKGGFTDD